MSDSMEILAVLAAYYLGRVSELLCKAGNVEDLTLLASLQRHLSSMVEEIANWKAAR